MIPYIMLCVLVTKMMSRISDKNDVLTLRVNYDKINQLEQNQKSVYMRRKRCRKLQALYRKRNHTDSIII